MIVSSKDMTTMVVGAVLCGAVVLAPFAGLRYLLSEEELRCTEAQIRQLECRDASKTMLDITGRITAICEVHSQDGIGAMQAQISERLQGCSR